jgi:peptide alpha-N-acetyltransferase
MYLYTCLLEMSGDYTQALLSIDTCIEHTPTSPDMLAKKAKLLKKSGDLHSASVYMDACRRLDLQDRYLNNKATKYFLRADCMNNAMETIAMFTKHDGDPQQTLYDLQCKSATICTVLNTLVLSLLFYILSTTHYKLYIIIKYI